MLAKQFQNIFIYGNIISLCMFPLIIYLSRNKTKYKVNHIYKIFLIMIFILLLPLFNCQFSKNLKSEKAEGQLVNDEPIIYEQTEDMKSLLIENNNLLNKNIEVNNSTIYMSVQYLPYIWIGIVCIVIIYNLITYLTYIKTLNIKYIENVQEFIKSKDYNKKIKTNIHMGLSKKINNPISIGLLKKTIIFPDEEIDNNDFKYMIAHELFHIKNRDIECKFLLLLLNSLYWFNPIVLFLSKQINEMIEQNADYNVLKNENINYRIEYGKTLLKQIEKNTTNKYQIITNFADSKKSIINRFYNITSTDKKSKSIIIMNFFVIVSIIAFTLILLFPNINFAITSDNIKDLPNNQEQESSILNSTEYIKPITNNCYISNDFSEKHKAIDIGINTENNEDIEIMAIHSGIVSEIGFDNDLGNFIVIESGNGVTTLYACCSNINVSENEIIEQGSIIALVGKTGRATGLHLHLEMSINGKIVNPQELIRF